MKIALITGATSGIGEEFYKQIAMSETELDEIWCVGRNQKKLFGLPNPCKGKKRPFVLDLSEENAIRSLNEALRSVKNADIRLLVNAAGTGKYGEFEKTAYEELTSTVRINCESLTGLTAVCLPFMKENSKIIQICSAAAFFPQPDFAVYSASKAYVLSFSKALAVELKRRKISITCVCPGPVDTPFLSRSREGITVPAYKNKGLAAPQKVVSKALKDAKKGKMLSIYGKKIQLLYAASRILPSELFTGFTDYLNH